MSRDKKQAASSKQQAELHKKVEELTAALQRERADATNVRRRADEDRSRMGNFYKVLIVRELLPAIDNLERALMHTPKDLKDHDYVKGVQSVAKQFEQVFKQLGVERIKTVGQHFDPKYHEAVHMEAPSFAEASEGGDEIVSKELQPGYKLGDEVIRHATVKVKMERK